MNKKEKLISIAIKNKGDYKKIKEDIISGTSVEYVACQNCFTIFDDIYPKELLDLTDPPFVLFYKGNLDLLKQEKIGIVGSRFPTDYALKATRALVNNKKEVVVSGLAKGIDACAQSSAKRSIGILGSGIDYIYPKENKELYHKLEKEGLLLSEYPNNTVPFAYHFPFRNRIISALSREVYVMELNEKSGTMTTVNETLKLGKDVKVLPFSVFSEKDVYNNTLINEGALMISYNDLFN